MEGVGASAFARAGTRRPVVPVANIKPPVARRLRRLSSTVISSFSRGQNSSTFLPQNRRCSEVEKLSKRPAESVETIKSSHNFVIARKRTTFRRGWSRQAPRIRRSMVRIEAREGDGINRLRPSSGRVCRIPASRMTAWASSTRSKGNCAASGFASCALGWRRPRSWRSSFVGWAGTASSSFGRPASAIRPVRSRAA